MSRFQAMLNSIVPIVRRSCVDVWGKIPLPMKISDNKMRFKKTLAAATAGLYPSSLLLLRWCMMPDEARFALIPLEQRAYLSAGPPMFHFPDHPAHRPSARIVAFRAAQGAGISAKLVMSKIGYTSGEPIPVSLVVTNHSSQPIHYYRWPGMSHGGLRIRSSHYHARYMGVVPTLNYVNSPEAFVTIRPGEHVKVATTDVNGLYQVGKTPGLRPAQWKLSATYGILFTRHPVSHTHSFHDLASISISNSVDFFVHPLLT